MLEGCTPGLAMQPSQVRMVDKGFDGTEADNVISSVKYGDLDTTIKDSALSFSRKTSVTAGEVFRNICGSSLSCFELSVAHQNKPPETTSASRQPHPNFHFDTPQLY